MKSGTNHRPRPDLKELLKGFHFHTLIAYADSRQQDFFLDWIEQDRQTFRASLRYESALLDEISDFLHEDESRYALLRLGSLLGTVESFERVLFEQAQDQWAQARFQGQIRHVKHLPEVVLALETHGSMCHAELCKYLHLNPPTLTEAMKKVLDTGAVQASIIGKYKVYALTDSGLRYGRELRKKKREGDPMEEALQAVLQFMEYAGSDLSELELFKDKLSALLRGRAPEPRQDSIDTHQPSYYSPIDERILSQNAIPQAAAPAKPARAQWPGSLPCAAYISSNPVYITQKRDAYPTEIIFGAYAQYGSFKSNAHKRRTQTWQTASPQKSAK